MIRIILALLASKEAQTRAEDARERYLDALAVAQEVGLVGGKACPGK